MHTAIGILNLVEICYNIHVEAHTEDWDCPNVQTLELVIIIIVIIIVII